MFLLDDRYMTLVAFVEGCNAATDWQLLDGFNGWVAAQVLGAESSLHWSTVVASKSDRQLLEEPRTAPIASELESVASDDLLDLLDSFLASKDRLVQEPKQS
jgi:hypothetical protein